MTFEEAKRAIRDIAEVISGEVPATFTEEVVRRISAATFADPVAFTETLQQHKEDFSSLLQHVANCCKALLADESSCMSASVAIIHLLTQRTSLRIFMHCIRILLRLPCWRMTHYCVILEKGCTTEGIGSSALLSLVYSWWYPFPTNTNTCICRCQTNNRYWLTPLWQSVLSGQNFMGKLGNFLKTMGQETIIITYFMHRTVLNEVKGLSNTKDCLDWSITKQQIVEGSYANSLLYRYCISHGIDRKWSSHGETSIEKWMNEWMNITWYICVHPFVTAAWNCCYSAHAEQCWVWSSESRREERCSPKYAISQLVSHLHWDNELSSVSSKLQ